MSQEVSFDYTQLEGIMLMIWHLNIRGVCPFRCSYVRLWIFGRYNIPIRVDLDIGHCLGDPRTVSCNVDCCKTLSRIARILKTMGRWGLFHGISKEPRVLLCKVRSCDLNVVIFLAQVHTSFIAVSTLELINFSPNLYVCMPPISISDIYIWPVLIVSTELNLRGRGGLYWHYSIFSRRSDVYIGTTPHPWTSRISC